MTGCFIHKKTTIQYYRIAIICHRIQLKVIANNMLRYNRYTKKHLHDSVYEKCRRLCNESLPIFQLSTRPFPLKYLPSAFAILSLHQVPNTSSLYIAYHTAASSVHLVWFHQTYGNTERDQLCPVL